MCRSIPSRSRARCGPAKCLHTNAHPCVAMTVARTPTRKLHARDMSHSPKTVMLLQGSPCGRCSRNTTGLDIQWMTDTHTGSAYAHIAAVGLPAKVPRMELCAYCKTWEPVLRADWAAA
jgi:hypothetical protein